MALNCWLSAHTGTVVVSEAEDGKLEVTGDPITIVKRLDSVTEPGEIFDHARSVAAGVGILRDGGGRQLPGARSSRAGGAVAASPVPLPAGDRSRRDGVA